MSVATTSVIVAIIGIGLATYMDAAIGRLLKTLDKLKLRDNTLLKIYNTLRYELPEVTVDESIAKDAVKPIERMLELS